MKNPTILKGELSILFADRSLVLTELRKASTELEETKQSINELEMKREGVIDEILEKIARLDKLKGRAIFETASLKELSQDLKNRENQSELFKKKNAQEEKLYLGRIKDLKEQEAEALKEIGYLKSLFDNNSEVFNNQESVRRSEIIVLDKAIEDKSKALQSVLDNLETREENEKKITKERLKREDKVRLREKNLDSLEESMKTREKDLITMSKDMMVVYGRLKELYAQTKPGADLDKLILKAK